MLDFLHINEQCKLLTCFAAWEHRRKPVLLMHSLWSNQDPLIPVAPQNDVSLN